MEYIAQIKCNLKLSDLQWVENSFIDSLNKNEIIIKAIEKLSKVDNLQIDSIEIIPIK